MLTRITRRIVATFATTGIEKAQNSQVVDASSSKELEVPVHLKPYDRARYEQPLQRIKLNSETSVYRIFQEERTKYIMKIVDEEPDVERLEDYFAVETIEIFIDNLVGQLEVINAFRERRVWEIESTDEYIPEWAN
ncbi:unnamed protein product [Sphagnum balticum]